MEQTSEDIVTRLLSSNEFIHCNSCNTYVTTPIKNNLGSFLEEIKNTPSPYEDKYMFIR